MLSKSLGRRKTLARGGEHLGSAGKSGAQDHQQAYVVGHGGRSIAVSLDRYGGAYEYTDPNATTAVAKLQRPLFQGHREKAYQLPVGGGCSDVARDHRGKWHEIGAG